MFNNGVSPCLQEELTMQRKSMFIGALAAVALVAAPMAPASAHGYYRHGGGLFYGLAALGTAAIVGAATIATAPLRVLAPPVVYGPPRAPAYYYAPVPQYYAPAPTYYAPPPGYYGR
jgi:hypothetical protein